MINTKEDLITEIAKLTKRQLQEVAEYIAFLKFRTQSSLPLREEDQQNTQTTDFFETEDPLIKTDSVDSIDLSNPSTDFNLIKTETWDLVGTLTVSEPDSKYVIGVDEAGEPITNYAEHVDDILYGPVK